MTKASYLLKLPSSVKVAAQRLAREDGVSLNQWIAVAVAQKVGAVETAADFLKRRAGNAKPRDMLPFLENAPDTPPDPGDELNATAAPHRDMRHARGFGEPNRPAAPHSARPRREKKVSRPRRQGSE